MAGGEYQIELVWRCSTCRHTNRGRDMACAGCGHPKDEGEQYEMPGDVSRAAAVSDPALVAMARAGANWRCRFCGSQARASWGGCAQCGAAPDGSRPGPALRVLRAARALPAGARWDRRVLYVAGAAFIAVFGSCGAFALLASRRPTPPRPVFSEPAPVAHRDVEATTKSAHFVNEVRVERWTIVDREGFAEAKPADATDVRQDGERVHHHDKVQKGTKTESYVDYEPRTETETYTEREACGQDCETIPQTCRPVCTNNQNGFATCRDECSGGGQRCSTRYCMNTKTRTVTKQVPVKKTREVPNIVDVPRSAPYYRWKQWDWAPNRTVKKEGDGFEVAWPSADEIRLGQGLAKGEKEREVRSSRYTVRLEAADGTSHETFPSTLDAFLAFRDARASLRVYETGRVEVLEGPKPR